MKLFLVSYDVRDPTRLRRVAKVMQGWGDRIQYSVFRCPLSDRQRAELVASLVELIDHSEDQVLFIDLGSVDHPPRFDTLGLPIVPIDRVVRII
jgi:CRISPR-associated protein Cas2